MILSSFVFRFNNSQSFSQVYITCCATLKSNFLAPWADLFDLHFFQQSHIVFSNRFFNLGSAPKRLPSATNVVKVLVFENVHSQQYVGTRMTQLHTDLLECVEVTLGPSKHARRQQKIPKNRHTQNITSPHQQTGHGEFRTKLKQMKKQQSQDDSSCLYQLTVSPLRQNLHNICFSIVRV